MNEDDSIIELIEGSDLRIFVGISETPGPLVAAIDCIVFFTIISVVL